MREYREKDVGRRYEVAKEEFIFFFLACELQVPPFGMDGSKQDANGGSSRITGSVRDVMTCMGLKCL